MEEVPRCEICGEPVTSGVEGSWSRDPEGKKRFFHDRCLKEIAENPAQEQSHNIKPFEPMLWELH